MDKELIKEMIATIIYAQHYITIGQYNKFLQCITLLEKGGELLDKIK
jgi:hypothetical protein